MNTNVANKNKQHTCYLNFSFTLFDRENFWMVRLYGRNDTAPLLDPRYIGDVIIRLKGHQDNKQLDNQKWFGIGNFWLESRYIYRFFQIFIAACR